MKKNKTITICLIISLGLHLFLLIIPLRYQRQIRSPSPIIVNLLDEKDTKQVVDAVQKPIIEKEPEKTRFLSKYNQMVDKEMKASQSGPTKNLQYQPGAKIVKINVPPTKTQSANFFLAQDDKEAEVKLSKKELLPKVKDLLKVNRVPSYVPPAKTDDYLPDIKDSMQTLLNTREFVFYSYYERIKQQLRLFWEPKLREKISRLQVLGKPLDQNQFITKLKIILTAEGRVAEVVVIQGCGVTEIDEAALEAFKLASPFPNPPRGMIEQDGTIKLRWDFVLQQHIPALIKIFMAKH